MTDGLAVAAIALAATAGLLLLRAGAWWLVCRLFPADAISSDRRIGPNPISLGLACLALLVPLAALVELILDTGGAVPVDLAANAALSGWRTPAATGAFAWITEAGTGAALTAITLTATGFLWARRRRDMILPLWLAFLGAEATTWAAKYAVDRARPAFAAGVSAISPSFPSAHATGAMAVYGFVAYLLARDLPGRRARFEIRWWAGVLVALIAASRVYLSVHFVTDVAAGLLVGALWLLAGIALAERRRASSGA